MKVVGIDLTRELILIHYVEEKDQIIDERVAAVKWKANPALRKLIQAFAEIVTEYAINENRNLEELESVDLNQLFKDLLDDEKN